MLLNNFFSISNVTVTDGVINTDITIDAAHHIFDGHFPGQPVVPGVCMMQMVKEIVETVIQQKTNLVKGHDLKFMAVIDPSQNNQVSATLKYTAEANGNLLVTASFFKDELTHFKFKGSFALL